VGFKICVLVVSACAQSYWNCTAWCSARRVATAGTALLVAGHTITGFQGQSTLLPAYGEGLLDLKIPPQSGNVVDLGGLLTDAQEQEVEAAIAALERSTPYRFRLFSPPPARGPENKADWPNVVRAVKSHWAQSDSWDAANAIVLLVSPRMSSGRTGNPLNFSLATRLTEKLQYRIASDTFTKMVNKFGDPGFIARVGEGDAVVLAALNAVACLRKGACIQPLPDDEARALALGKMSVSPSTTR